MEQKFKCISLFSGAGGLDLGLEAAGFETILATDIDEHSCNALTKNKEYCLSKKKPFLNNAQILCEDITKLTGNDLLEITGLKIGELDLLAGGPPCQAFSVFGNRKGANDPRGQLVFHYLRLIAEIKPKAFVFENVSGLLTVDKGQTFKELSEKLSNPVEGLNYTLSILRLNSSNFGVPQFRDRIFIIGSLTGKKIKSIDSITSDASELQFGCLPFRTVRDGLRNIKPIGHKGTHNHIGRVHSERIIKRYSEMKFGQRDHFTRINRLDPDRPSYTIVVGSNAGGGKGHVHPYEAREVTPRESARMQCFPDWWWFSGTSRHPIRQVGNAVPTLLAFAVGKQVLKDIFNVKLNSTYDAIKLLGQEHLFTNAELETLQKIDCQMLQVSHQTAKTA